MDDYQKELNIELGKYFEKYREITKDMTPVEEKNYNKKNNTDEEIKAIYKKVREKYGLDVSKY